MKSDKTLPFVSVITLNWNGKRFLEKLLPLLEKQTYPRDRYEIIVVDNHSTKDDSVAYVQKNFPNVRLIQNKDNYGFAKGMNVGMKRAKGDYLALINNDTEPKNTWLHELVKCATIHNAGGVVPKLLFANKPNIINNAGSLLHPDRSWPIEELGANLPDGPDFNKERSITALCGASPLINRAMLKDVGLFDEAFFMYFEDGDLSWRAQKAGWKFFYCPTSVVLHEHSGSSVEHSPFWTFYVTRNRLLILCKHARPLLALRAYASFIKQFQAVPIVRGLQGRERRHQLHTLTLGIKIHASFLRHVIPALLKRFHLVKETTL